MLVNNGKAFLYFSDYGLDIDGNLIWNPQYELCRTNGLVATAERYTDKQPEGMNYSYLAGSLELVFGSGDTEPTVQDIKLENEITVPYLVTISKDSENLHNLTGKTASNSFPILHATKVIKNNSLEDNITINEIGMIAKDGYGFSYLLIREVLDSPYILEPQDTATFTLTLDDTHAPQETPDIYLLNNFKNMLCAGNYYNGKNHAGGTNRPYIRVYCYNGTGVSQENTENTIFKGGISLYNSPVQSEDSRFKDTNKTLYYITRNLTCTIGNNNSPKKPSDSNIWDSNNSGHLTSYNYNNSIWTNIITKSSYNSDNEKVSFLNPVIAQATTTIKNNTNSNMIIKSIGLESGYSQGQPAPYFETDEMGWHNIRKNGNVGWYPEPLYNSAASSQTRYYYTVCSLASYTLDEEDWITLEPGEMATFSIMLN